ncbi:class I SAM-dependent methyltransferase [Streptoalloteichus hindustanus]|uniref:Methyltransferase domain-containing protein n=1 Tax=Streptoalloteichus hindustanus TaxID=2017 RepID=A0A1M4YZG6_STRHI|nr:class I SAM-dependent methyltransferase [Streptoalloteichus hindustanus]SHF11204.1 Methyltransferase domain-containing protein [Streptoalloteichus hindustanus]
MPAEHGEGSPPTRRSLVDMYGHAYLKAEEVGGRPGLAHLVYQLADGTAFSEDVAHYYAPPDHWWPTDVMACERAVGRVLDIGCGAGRHALAVAAAGHETVAVDPARGAVAVARRRGVDARVGGLGSLPPGIGRFDTFLLAGGGIHLLGVLDNARKALTELAAVARPGARILGTCLRLREGEGDGTCVGVGVRTVGARELASGRARYRLRVEHGAEVGEWSEWGYTADVPPERLANIVAGTGWVVAEVTETESVALPVFELGHGVEECRPSAVVATDGDAHLPMATYFAVLRLDLRWRLALPWDAPA